MAITRTRIFLTDYDIEVNIGVHAFEKTAAQRLLVSVSLEVDPAPDDAADDLAEVLDYDFLRREVAGLAAVGRYNLQETFCRKIVTMLAERAEVRRATVSTRKPDVYPDCAWAGVEMVYERDP